MLGAVLALEGSVVASGIIMGLLCAAIGYWIGNMKGRGILGLILGLLLGIIGLVIILLINAFVHPKHDSPEGYAPPPAPS